MFTTIFCKKKLILNYLKDSMSEERLKQKIVVFDASIKFFFNLCNKKQKRIE